MVCRHPCKVMPPPGGGNAANLSGHPFQTNSASQRRGKFSVSQNADLEAVQCLGQAISWLAHEKSLYAGAAPIEPSSAHGPKTYLESVRAQVEHLYAEGKYHAGIAYTRTRAMCIPHNLNDAEYLVRQGDNVRDCPKQKIGGKEPAYNADNLVVCGGSGWVRHFLDHASHRLRLSRGAQGHSPGSLGENPDSRAQHDVTGCSLSWSLE